MPNADTANRARIEALPVAFTGIFGKGHKSISFSLQAKLQGRLDSLVLYGSHFKRMKKTQLLILAIQIILF